MGPLTRYLLDACTLIWFASEPEKLPTASASLIDSSDSELLWSDVSTLEIALKWSSGKIELPDPPRTWLERQIDNWDLVGLPLKRADIYRASELPALHRDPFDRLLVATGIGSDATILTPDATIAQYPVSCQW